jgi:hypothetical protein
LEKEGAECDIQFVTNWLLYMLWEGRYDTKLRGELKGLDDARKSLKDAKIGQKLASLFVADGAIRALFHVFGAAIGFHGYHLPDMDEVAQTANQFYDNQLRGGEGHMEVGKFILNVLHNKSHMTLSVKPFGCMPSSGVSDGVQSTITGKYPSSIFCAIETSGDGKVNVQSRVQMFLFKARLAAQNEYNALLEKHGLKQEDVEAFFEAHPRFASGLHRSPHAAAGTAADRLEEFAPYIGKTKTQIAAMRVQDGAKSLWRAASMAPAFVARTRKRIAEKTPVLMAQAKEEWVEIRPVLEQEVRTRTQAGLEKLTQRFKGERAAA